jgi:hypothetical protein
VLEDKISLGMVLQNDVLPDQFCTFSHGCLEEDCPRNICPNCYVLNNDRTLGSPAALTSLYSLL